MEASEGLEPTETPEATAEPTPETGTETSAEPTEASPPDVSDAIAQMNQRFDAIEQRLPQAEPESDFDFNSLFTDEEPETGTGTETETEAQPAGESEPQGDNMAALEQFIDQRAQAQIDPVLDHLETVRRSEGIERLAEKYPELNTRDIGQAVRERLDMFGLLPEGAIPPDPAYVELVYKAYKADAVASAEQTPEAGESREGATLETGAGPGAPEPEPDPIEAAYLKALGGGANLGSDGLGESR